MVTLSWVRRLLFVFAVRRMVWSFGEPEVTLRVCFWWSYSYQNYQQRLVNVVQMPISSAGPGLGHFSPHPELPRLQFLPQSISLGANNGSWDTMKNYLRKKRDFRELIHTSLTKWVSFVGCHPKSVFKRVNETLGVFQDWMIPCVCVCVWLGESV